MQLARTALRLAVIEVLAPHALYSAAAPVWPTLAKGRVYDSGIGPAPATEAEGRLPRIAVYTDDGTAEPAGEDLAGGALGVTTTVTLGIELFMPGVMLAEDGSEELTVAAPTDAMAEAMLELMGAQVHAALMAGRMVRPLALAGMLAVRKCEVRGWRDPDTDLRLSSHRLEYEIALADQAAPVALSALPEGGSPFDRLPEPLRSVAHALPAGSYGAAVCSALAALVVDPAVLPDLVEMRLAATLARAAGDPPAPPADAATTPPTGDLGGSVVFPVPD